MFRSLFFVALLAVVPGCDLIYGESEEEIPLDQVPQVVKDAALNAVPGIELSEAEIETEDGRTVYELEGTADGVEYEIEVTADGEVIEVERADEEDDDDGDDD